MPARPENPIFVKGILKADEWPGGHVGQALGHGLLALSRIPGSCLDMRDVGSFLFQGERVGRGGGGGWAFRA